MTPQAFCESNQRAKQQTVSNSLQGPPLTVYQLNTIEVALILERPSLQRARHFSSRILTSSQPTLQQDPTVYRSRAKCFGLISASAKAICLPGASDSLNLSNTSVRFQAAPRIRSTLIFTIFAPLIYISYFTLLGKCLDCQDMTNNRYRGSEWKEAKDIPITIFCSDVGRSLPYHFSCASCHICRDAQ